MKLKKSSKKMTLEKLALMMGRGFNAIEFEMREIKRRLVKLEENYSYIVETLDAFMKRMIDQEDEFALLKNETNIVKKVLKRELSIDVDASEFR